MLGDGHDVAWGWVHRLPHRPEQAVSESLSMSYDMLLDAEGVS